MNREKKRKKKKSINWKTNGVNVFEKDKTKKGYCVSWERINFSVFPEARANSASASKFSAKFLPPHSFFYIRKRQEQCRCFPPRLSVITLERISPPLPCVRIF